MVGVCVLLMFEKEEGVGVAGAQVSSGRVCTAPTANV
jgi:hypothetical protein